MIDIAGEGANYEISSVIFFQKSPQFTARFARSEEGSVEGVIVGTNGFAEPFESDGKSSSKELEMTERPLPIDPKRFRLAELISMGEWVRHELALRAVGTLTSSRLTLGRCLLAIQDAGDFKKHGCSCEMVPVLQTSRMT